MQIIKVLGYLLFHQNIPATKAALLGRILKDYSSFQGRKVQRLKEKHKKCNYSLEFDYPWLPSCLWLALWPWAGCVNCVSRILLILGDGELWELPLWTAGRLMTSKQSTQDDMELWPVAWKNVFLFVTAVLTVMIQETWDSMVASAFASAQVCWNFLSSSILFLNLHYALLNSLW